MGLEGREEEGESGDWEWEGCYLDVWYSCDRIPPLSFSLFSTHSVLLHLPPPGKISPVQLKVSANVGVQFLPSAASWSPHTINHSQGFPQTGGGPPSSPPRSCKSSLRLMISHPYPTNPRPTVPSNPGEMLRMEVIYCLAPVFVFNSPAVGSAKLLAELPDCLKARVGLCHCLTRERALCTMSDLKKCPLLTLTSIHLATEKIEWPPETQKCQKPNYQEMRLNSQTCYKLNL